jgi:Protease inhibitor Inh
MRQLALRLRFSLSFRDQFWPAFRYLLDAEMTVSKRMGISGRRGVNAAAAVLVLLALGACATTPAPEPPPVAAEPPPPPPAPSPPPVDLAGRWRLTAAAGGACFMTLGDTAGAAQGTIAPEGGCPGSFFTSRKWTFEQGNLIIRNHKGEQLAQLSFTGGHFEGKDNSGGSLSLSR